SGGAVDRLAVLAEDLLEALARQPRWEGPERIVEVPVRIVSGKQQAIPADPLQHVEEVLAVPRFLHRLAGDPDVFADHLRWPPFQVRDLAAHALKQLVEPPAQRRQPGKAPLDDHQLQIGIALEYPLHHQAGDERLAGVSVTHVLFPYFG